jgi:hypothetical protein
VTELALVALFTLAGVGAALLAFRLSSGSRLIRALVSAFCLLALANLAFYVWRVVAQDPGGAAQAGMIVAVLALTVWTYRRLLRAVRRRAERHGPGPQGP